MTVYKLEFLHHLWKRLDISLRVFSLFTKQVSTSPSYSKKYASDNGAKMGGNWKVRNGEGESFLLSTFHKGPGTCCQTLRHKTSSNLCAYTTKTILSFLLWHIETTTTKNLNCVVCRWGNWGSEKLRDSLAWWSAPTTTEPHFLPWPGHPDRPRASPALAPCLHSLSLPCWTCTQTLKPTPMVFAAW